MRSKLFILVILIMMLILLPISAQVSSDAEVRGANVLNKKNQTTSIRIVIPHFLEYTENKDDYRLIEEDSFWQNMIEYIEKVIGNGEYDRWFSLTSSGYQKSMSNSSSYFNRIVVDNRKKNFYTYQNHAVINEDTVKVTVKTLKSGLEFPVTFVMEKGFWKIEQDITKPEAQSKEAYPEDKSKLDPRILFKIEDIEEEEDLEAHIKGLFDNIEEKVLLGDFEGYWYSLSLTKRTELEDPVTWEYWSRHANMIIRSEKDYFMKVVVKVREDLKLAFDGFEVISNEEVKVYCRHNLHKDRFSYTFIFENGAWRLNK